MPGKVVAGRGGAKVGRRDGPGSIPAASVEAGRGSGTAGGGGAARPLGVLTMPQTTAAERISGEFTGTVAGNPPNNSLESALFGE